MKITPFTLSPCILSTVLPLSTRPIPPLLLLRMPARHLALSNTINYQHQHLPTKQNKQQQQIKPWPTMDAPASRPTSALLPFGAAIIADNDTTLSTAMAIGSLFNDAHFITHGALKIWQMSGVGRRYTYPTLPEDSTVRDCNENEGYDVSERWVEMRRPSNDKNYHFFVLLMPESGDASFPLSRVPYHTMYYPSATTDNNFQHKRSNKHTNNILSRSWTNGRWRTALLPTTSPRSSRCGYHHHPSI